MATSDMSNLNNEYTTSQQSHEKSCKKYSKSSGRWTREEHLKFIEGLKYFGKNWRKVEEYIGTRSGAQIRSHAQKFFNRLEKECKKKKKIQDDYESDEQEESSNDEHFSQAKMKLFDEFLSFQADQKNENQTIQAQQENSSQSNQSEANNIDTDDNHNNRQLPTQEGIQQQPILPCLDLQKNSLDPVQNGQQMMNPSLIYYLMSQMNQNAIDQIRIPKLYDLCMLGMQQPSMQQPLQEIKVEEDEEEKKIEIQPKKKNRAGSFQICRDDSQNQEKNLKLQNLRRKCSSDIEEINKKIKVENNYENNQFYLQNNYEKNLQFSIR